MARSRWSARGMSAVRRDTIETIEVMIELSGVPSADAALEWSSDDPFPWMFAEHNMWRTARLHWLTEDTTAMTVEAARDLPFLDALAPPCVSGIVAVERPLPPVSTTLLDENPATFGAPIKVPVDAVGWYHTPGAGTMLAAYGRPEMFPEGSPGAEMFGVSALVQIVTGSFPPDVTQWPDLHQDDLDPLQAWIATVWSFLNTPALTRTIPMDKNGKPLPKRFHPHHDPDKPAKKPPLSAVHVVDMRPVRHTPEPATDETGGREYQRRWMVRGHWRNQPVGPERNSRRLTWIPPHLKGPDGAPFTPTDTVWKW